MLLKLQSRTARLLSFRHEPTLRRFCTHCGPMFLFETSCLSSLQECIENRVYEEPAAMLLTSDQPPSVAFRWDSPPPHPESVRTDVRAYADVTTKILASIGYQICLPMALRPCGLRPQRSSARNKYFGRIFPGYIFPHL